MNRSKVAALALAAVAGFSGIACSTQLKAGEQAVIADDYIIIPTDPKLTGCHAPEVPGPFSSALNRL